MGSLSDNLLADGYSLLESVHGEQVTVLTGLDAGKKFTAIKENAPDVMLDSDMVVDPRAKRIIRFKSGNVPRISDADVIQTSDGKLWRTVKYPQSGYLSEDFELVEITAKDQQ